MAKAANIEQQLSALAALRSDAKSETAKIELTKALASKSNLIVAKATTILTDSNQADFLPQLAKAFDRFFADGADKGCNAKTALGNALYTLGHNDAAAFLRGVHHIQMEASFGAPVDAAAELRGWCALGLARVGYPDVLLELAELLVDKEPQPRIMAIRAIAYTGSDAGAPLLRMKALAGDAHADVTAECFAALAKISPRKSLPFLARFLDSDAEEIQQAAAVAIGSSRQPDALELLRAKWESYLSPEQRQPLLLGIAMARLPAAIDFLLERITDDRPQPAADAIAAMAMFKHDETIRDRVKSIVSDRDEPALTMAMSKSFG